jgi:hypothetical protein
MTGCAVLGRALAATLERGTAVTGSNPRHFEAVLPRRPVAPDALDQPKYELVWKRPYGAVREPSRADLAVIWGGGASIRSLRREQWRLGGCDFVRQRAVRYDEGQGWSVFAPGRHVLGQSDGWHELAIDDTTLGQWDPLWLVALVGGTVRAELLDSGEQPAPGWRRYDGSADTDAASAVFGRPLSKPRAGRSFDPDGHSLFEVLIDPDDLIRRISLPYGKQALELGDFEAPVMIEVPPEDEISPAPTYDD